jgi:hypothetical protein
MLETSSSQTATVIPFPSRGLPGQRDLFLAPSSSPTIASTGIVEEIGVQSIEHIAAALGLSK